ncbi:olfactory receptor 478-like [Spea bombifrons]|uniref:olfactory receptor 478-like n=1 Tax=Spea bombifrons TaxID=233779 RepID=UPI00234BB809|nr:olfactory receptor 478-like [Spea bombifrons]
MCQANETVVTEFLLLGFQNLNNHKILLFVVFLIVYIVILSENFVIILLVSVSHYLKHPMYFFLKHLAFADILSTSNIIPNLLHVILREGSHVVPCLCIFQYYFHCFSGFSQSLILMVMSFDRYLAVCNPLRYTSFMNFEQCLRLVIMSWAGAFILISSEIILMYQLQFCGSKTINHLFCDFAPIVELSSSDTTILSWYDFLLSMCFIFFPFVLVTVSYIYIFITILKISSITGRKKAFSTCSSHLAVVCTYYGTLVAVYVLPSGENSSNENKFKSLLYIVLTPMINPIIYSLRSQEIMGVLKKFIHTDIWTSKS